MEKGMGLRASSYELRASSYGLRAAADGVTGFYKLHL
jgi:hypothetical protein